MSDKNNNGHHSQDEPQLPVNPDDVEPVPDFIPARPGRMVSLAGLTERIIEQFQDEYGEEGATLKQTTASERRKILRDVTDYVLGVESVMLEPAEKAGIMQHAYSDIFGYGPLDALFANERVTTIALEGAGKVSVRYEPGTELKTLEPIFEDSQQMRRMIQRLVRDAGAELNEDTPILEVGLTIQQRPVCLSLVMPPFVIQPTADIRVHPVQAPSLSDLVEDDFLTEDAAQFLKALIDATHGFIIVGDTEAGKTTLLNAILQALPQPENTVTVERAGELHTPESVEQFIVKWPVEEEPEITFGECIEKALETNPGCLLLDEVRADEPHSIAPLLNQDDVPRQIWSFRGSAMPLRIRSSLAQLARMAYPAQPEAMVYAIYERLPFIIIVQRRRGYIRLRGIAEWQFDENNENAEFVDLMTIEDDSLIKTGKLPTHTLDLPDEFWAAH